MRVAGANLTPFGRLKEGLLELLAQATQPLTDHEPQALAIGVWSPVAAGDVGNLASALTERLSLSPAAAWTVEAASATGAAALHSGWRAVASGQYERVLVVAGEKLTHLETPEATRLLGSVLTPKERAAGGSMVSMAAQVTAEGFASGRFTPEALQAVALKNHTHGQLNPLAHFQNGLTDEQYLNSRMIAEPLRLYDCAPISDGAAALLLERERGGGDKKGEAGEVVIAGIGQATDRWPVAQRRNPLRFCTEQASRQAAKMAGWPIATSTVDVVEMHDAFTPFELLGLEACHLMKEGQAGPATLAGETDLEGRLPVNPSGGLKARGHPIGASGLAQACELYWQLTEQAGKRQVAGTPRRALAHSIGGLAANNLVTLLERK